MFKHTQLILQKIKILAYNLNLNFHRITKLR